MKPEHNSSPNNERKTENTFMNTERHPRTKRSHRCGHELSATNRHGHQYGARTRQHWHEYGEEDMTTPEREITRRPRSGHRHHDNDAAQQEGEAFLTRRDFGRHARGSRKEAHGEHQQSGRRGGRGHLHRTIAEMQDRIDDMERRMHRMLRMQRMAKRRAMHGARPFEERESCQKSNRTRHSGRDDQGHHAYRMRGEGRRMGRMMYRAWRDRQIDA